MTEVNLDAEHLFKLSVADEENVVVPGNRFHFRIPLFHSSHGVFQGTQRYRVYLLKKRVAELSVGVYEEQSLSVLSRCDEITFHVADSLSRVDTTGSFVNHTLVFDLESAFAFPAPPPAELVSARLDSPSIGTLDVEPYGGSRHRGEVFVIFREPPRYMLGRLVVHEIRVNRFLKLWMLNNRIRTDAAVVLADPCFVLRIVRIIPPTFSRLGRYLIRYRSLRYADSLGDFLLRVSFTDKDVNLVSVAFRKSFFFCFFMRLF